jgi:AcrR family transcriptional regulator
MARTADGARTAETKRARPGPKSAKDKTPSAERRRLRVKPEERYKEFVSKAIELFSEVGFDAGTRELAQRLNVTQPLLYRYFPSKEKLIEAVYEEIYLARWKPAWTAVLFDQSRPLPDRLQSFYEDYTDTVFTPEWLRIYMFAGLRGVNINARYVVNVEQSILEPIALEARRHLGLSTDKAVTPQEIELFWTLHGGVFYYGVRKVVYGFECRIDKSQMIRNAIAAFLEGARSVLPTLEVQQQDPPKRAVARTATSVKKKA